MAYTLNMNEVTYALSEALDYVGIDDTMHGKRVAYMSAEIAKKLDWAAPEIDTIIMLGMLHDCGVSSTDVHSNLVNELDWNNAHVHCERGAMLLEKVPFYSHYAPAIFYHHTHWDSLNDAVDHQTRLNTNLIYLTDRVDSLRAQHGSQALKEKQQICETITRHSGTMFSPGLAEAFLELACGDAFWYYLEPEPLNDYFAEWIESGRREEVEYEQLKKLAMMFADIVDAKSTFTAEHTYGVAALARYLACLRELPAQQQESIELAAFFHDLGKLRVADAILHKPGPLDDEERAQMNRHGFDSQMVLHKVKEFKRIAEIAAMHHETLDGHGYPSNLDANRIPLEARILAVADIFQALVQNRPYRNGLNASEALAILEEMRGRNKLDGTVVDLVKANLERCYDYAMNPPHNGT